MKAEKKYDAVIVGQGLAGTLLAFKLFVAGKNILVIDHYRANSATNVAAGMFTPISGQRISLAWRHEELLKQLKHDYRALEKLLNQSFLYLHPVYAIYGSVKEQNDVSLKFENPAYSILLNPEPGAEPGVKADYGAMEISESGRLDTQKLTTQFRNFLKEQNLLLEEFFDYGLMKKTEQDWQYKNIRASVFIFCEGYRVMQNPFFNNLLFAPCKGEVLTIRCPDLSGRRIIKRGVYLVNLGHDLLKVGATYLWNNANEDCSEMGKSFLTEKLKEITDVPFEIVQHEAGVRPTVKDRMPVIGSHPQQSGIYICNGLGTKGVLYAPFISQRLVEYILFQKEIPVEISVKRFKK